ncbi:expressed protein [Phakopsora pachyrhizi]|uniref:Expressed protein n=1 Tax=Phakopsora pachyrhizi TaxID=170000 RepID=A0AAV0BPD0_PHAPC|nr:expressed protein [Phakopsora pachyrhizi]
MQLYEALIRLMWCGAAFHATVFGFITPVDPILSSKDYLESARETLALHDSISDPKFKAFGDLFSISRVDATESIEVYSQQASDIQCRAISSKLAPRINSKNELLISGSRGTASIARGAIEIVQHHLRKIQKPRNQLLYFPEGFGSKNTFGMDEAFLESMKKQFIDEFCKNFKILHKAKELKQTNYKIYKIKFNQDENEYYTWAELSLRALNCLLLSSPKINGEGRKVVQEILKDEEVLEIIKHQFSITVTKDNFYKELHINFEHYLKQNSWSHGIAEIFDELPKKDQFDIFSHSINSFFEFRDYKTLFTLFPSTTDNLPRGKEFVEFFGDSEALSKLLKENDGPAKSVSKFLIDFISDPNKIDESGTYKTLWIFAYYLVEFLVRNQNSIFFQRYRDQIIQNGLLEKIYLMKSHIHLKNEINRLLPESSYMKHREEKEIWEQLSGEKMFRWFEEYLKQLKKLSEDVENHAKQLEIHKNNQVNISFLGTSYDRNFRKILSAMLGIWIDTKMINYFWKISYKQVPSNVVELQRERHLPILQKAVQFRDPDSILSVVKKEKQKSFT